LKKIKFNLSTFNKIVLAFNCLAVIFMLLSYLSSFISPEHIWWLAIIGLAYPVNLIINLLFGIYWLITKNKRLSLLSFISILIGINTFFGFAQYNFSAKLPDKAKENHRIVKVMSYNVRLFDLYNWSHNFETRAKNV